MKFFIVLALCVAAASANKFLTCTTINGGIGGSLSSDDETGDLTVTRFDKIHDKGFIVCEDCDGNKRVKKIEWTEDYDAILEGFISGNREDACSPIECVFDEGVYGGEEGLDLECPNCNCHCGAPTCNCECPSTECSCTSQPCEDIECTNECPTCTCNDVTCGPAECSSVCPECNCKDLVCNEISCSHFCPECPACGALGDAVCDHCPDCIQSQTCDCPALPDIPEEICSPAPVVCDGTDDVIAYNDGQLCIFNGKTDPLTAEIFYTDNDGNTNVATLSNVAEGDSSCTAATNVAGICRCATERRRHVY